MFEESVLAIEPNCEIFVFDPTPSLQQYLPNITLPTNLHFIPWALRGDAVANVVIQNQVVESKSLDEVAQILGHDHIDILKIDVDWAEWQWIVSMAPDSLWTSGRIGQVLIEVHVEVNYTQRLMAWMNQFYALGFQLFHAEMNVWSIICWEFALYHPDYIPGGGGPGKVRGLSGTNTKTLDQMIREQPYDHEMIAEIHRNDVREREFYFGHYTVIALTFPGLYNFLEATYHCIDKVFVGDRYNDKALFFYLCRDKLPQKAIKWLSYLGIYSSFVKPKIRSSVESSLKTLYPSYQIVVDSFDNSNDATTTWASLLPVVETHGHVDVLKLDLLNNGHLFAEPQDLTWFLKKMLERGVNIIQVETHLESLNDRSDKVEVFKNIVKAIEAGGFEIYHKEVTYVDGEEGEPVSHGYISLIPLE
jgi:hypothetical protein